MRLTRIETACGDRGPVGVTVKLGFQPPVFGLSRAGAGGHSVEFELAGPSGLGGRFAGDLDRVAVTIEVVLRDGTAKVGAAGVVWGRHVE